MLSRCVPDTKERKRSQVLKFKIPRGISSISDNVLVISEHTICARDILFERWNSTMTIFLEVYVLGASEPIIINIAYTNGIIYIYNTCQISKYDLYPIFIKFLLIDTKNFTFQLRLSISDFCVIIDSWIQHRTLVVSTHMLLLNKVYVRYTYKCYYYIKLLLCKTKYTLEKLKKKKKTVNTSDTSDLTENSLEKRRD